MKTILTIISLFLTTLLSAQNDTLELIVDLKNIETRDIRNMIPDSKFTTPLKDTTLTGEIVELCKGYHIHHLGYILGILKIKSSITDSIFQIILPDNDQVNHLTKGQQVTVIIEPYNPDDKELNETTGLTCTTIRGSNLSKLKKIKTGTNNK
ncbi:hypothetical protein [Croceimicrobium hydrocarbonivorans]|uniref:DUF5666 domain-containing protein n=1 Tax=Croceimicrobium hydrocarbonivorans TaxID=2761580 RepID=A0A7H0VHB8_9FLAO|nr:hypothetical protein [Croceimicrobium hydrocarbonivorans]QNR25116.1 hypothetical protein H4K34_04565 [Croceimicrobium hydrocarbonivorans]